MAGIKPYLHGLLEEYARYRGQDHQCPDFNPFWDAVVITTSDADQQRAFLHQIEDKRQRRELPRGLPVHVISDPPGVRIGNGGSTMTALEHLESRYGLDSLCSMKIFLIHAGGWSQRMPSSSILGKIFSVIPYGNPPFQMLDLKLALYWPFVEKIQPGVFLVCADDFSVHNLGNEDFKNVTWDVPGRGFTALAHPSPMALGRAHGVYVVDESESLDFSQLVVTRKCLEVLQKPSDERMRSQGAIISNLNISKESSSSYTIFGDEVKVKGDIVYTDSCFHFGRDIVEKLVTLKKSLGELNCEIDAYGDFLQALGDRASEDYIYDVSNVTEVTASLLETRRRVFHALNGSDLNLLLLNSSAYIHIGTTRELVHHMCRDREFQDRLGLRNDVFNMWAVELPEDNCVNKRIEKGEFLGDGCCKDSSGDGLGFKQDNNIEKILDNACVIHSSINSKSKIGADSYVEFCDFEIPIEIVGNSVISNCQISLCGEGRVCSYNGAGFCGGICNDTDTDPSSADEDIGCCSGSRNGSDCNDDDGNDCCGGRRNGCGGSNDDRKTFCNCMITVPHNSFLHTIPILSPKNFNQLEHKDDNHRIYTFDNNADDDHEDDDEDDDEDDYTEVNLEAKQKGHSTHYASRFATITCDIDDNMKKCVPISDLGSLPFNGSTIDYFLAQRAMAKEDILPPPTIEHQSTSQTNKTCLKEENALEKNYDGLTPQCHTLPKLDSERKISLWDLKLYPAFPTMTSSFLDAVEVRQGHRVKVTETTDHHVEYYSLSELRALKDVERMLDYRKNLYKKIKEKCCSGNVE